MKLEPPSVLLKPRQRSTPALIFLDFAAVSLCSRAPSSLLLRSSMIPSRWSFKCLAVSVCFLTHLVCLKFRLPLFVTSTHDAIASLFQTFSGAPSKLYRNQQVQIQITESRMNVVLQRLRGESVMRLLHSAFLLMKQRRLQCL
ncbi:unnamed protein product [Vicia faba]|uniref:Uncharacterized protein n=1 Tax=Vicia faba TaxID=3906 RepID=A0AAV0ZQ81_VICFA|nr:unnamed protein product [Vicia faba]